MTAKADLTGRAKEKVSDAKDRVVDKAEAAQSAARDALTDSTGSVKRGVPIAAVIVAAAAVGGGVVVWRRRR